MMETFVRTLSTTELVEFCRNPARPWAKAKYGLSTDSEQVP